MNNNICCSPNLRIQKQLDDINKAINSLEAIALPPVSIEDDGKFLIVDEGKWTAKNLPQAENNKF